jgi:ubiquinone/menaquinone biosynthesis C-methylase UbiE
MREFYEQRYLKKSLGQILRLAAFHYAENSFFYSKLMKKFIGKKPRLLDIGCGWAIQSNLAALDTNAEVVKGDISVFAGQEVKQIDEKISSDHLIRYLGADLQALPFRSEIFDVVLCSHVIEHVPNDNQAISEISRVLKPNGVLIIAFPNCFKNMFDGFHALEKNFDEAGHLREYCEIDMLNLLTINGFNINKVNYYGYFWFWFLSKVERNTLGINLQRFLTGKVWLESILKNIFTILLALDNFIFNSFNSRGSLCIGIIAKKSMYKKGVANYEE